MGVGNAYTPFGSRSAVATDWQEACQCYVEDCCCCLWGMCVAIFDPVWLEIALGYLTGTIPEGGPSVRRISSAAQVDILGSGDNALGECVPEWWEGSADDFQGRRYDEWTRDDWNSALAKHPDGRSQKKRIREKQEDLCGDNTSTALWMLDKAGGNVVVRRGPLNVKVFVYIVYTGCDPDVCYALAPEGSKRTYYKCCWALLRFHFCFKHLSIKIIGPFCNTKGCGELPKFDASGDDKFFTTWRPRWSGDKEPCNTEHMEGTFCSNRHVSNPGDFWKLTIAPTEREFQPPRSR